MALSIVYRSPSSARWPDNCPSSRRHKLVFRRWLTLAARLLRLYIATESPTDQLHQIVEYLVGHYSPMWFHIRSHSNCIHGAGNVLRSLELLRTLPQSTQEIVQPVVQRNAYWVHPEAVLLAMVADQDQQVRAQAVQMIQRWRQQPRGLEVREFKIPQVNFAASDLAELIEFSTALITEPPLTMGLSDAAIEAIQNTPLEVGAYPVHTVAVERAVKVVTEAASAVIGEEARHGFICSRLRHRQHLPEVISKFSFVKSSGY